MTLPVLRRLAGLVEAGATVVGSAPEGSPSLNDDPAQYAALKARLWSGAPVTPFGKGRVMVGQTPEAALQALGVAPDFAYAKPAADSQVLFVHRQLADGEVYFVDNRRFRAEAVEARFRVTGKAPELWRADTGAFAPVSYRIEGDQTIVALDLGTIGDVAQVWINGKLAGTAWHAPYRVDLGGAVRPGKNALEIRVANLWVNRLIGDLQPGATRITFTSAPTYTAKAPLRPSGLIGPVTVLKATSR